MENILCNKYIGKNKDIYKDIGFQKSNYQKENLEEEDEDEIDNKIFNGLLIEDKKLNTNNSNNNNDKITTIEKNNSRNFDTYINENNNLVDINFISFGDVNSLYNFQNGKIDINSNKKIESKNKNNLNSNNKMSPLINKLNIKNAINNSPTKIENGSEEKLESQIPAKNKRKNSNGSLLDSNKNEEKANFLHKQIFKINSLFDGLNKIDEKKNKKNEEIVRNYWECRNFFKISEISKGNAILVSVDDNIINFPAFLLPKGAKIGETYTFEIKSMDKGFIYKNQKANEVDEIQKKYINPEENNEI